MTRGPEDTLPAPVLMFRGEWEVLDLGSTPLSSSPVSRDDLCLTSHKKRNEDFSASPVPATDLVLQVRLQWVLVLPRPSPRRSDTHRRHGVPISLRLSTEGWFVRSRRRRAIPMSLPPRVPKEEIPFILRTVEPPKISSTNDYPVLVRLVCRMPSRCCTCPP